MDENADASQAVFEPPPENWRLPPGRPRTTWMKNIHYDLSSLDLGICGAKRSGAKLASLETEVFAQCYALVVVHADIGYCGLPILWALCFQPVPPSMQMYVCACLTEAFSGRLVIDFYYHQAVCFEIFAYYTHMMINQ